MAHAPAPTSAPKGKAAQATRKGPKPTAVKPTAPRAPRPKSVPQAGALHSRLIQPDLLNRLEEVLKADNIPVKVNLTRGHRFVSVLVDVELAEYLDKEAIRINGLKSAGRLTSGRSTAHSLALTALASRLPNLTFYQQFLLKVQDRRRAIGQSAMSLRVPNRLYTDLEALHHSIAASDNKLISVKGIAEALIFAWATALKEENPFIPGGKTRDSRSASSRSSRK